MAVQARPAPMDHAGLRPGARSFEEARRASDSMALRLAVVRVLIVVNLLLGINYLAWRFTASINWHMLPLALLLLAAETYSFIDTVLFAVTLWKQRRRGVAPPPRGDERVDVFITCYNEPVHVVRETVRAAVAIRRMHRTWLLDDGNSLVMRRMAAEEGAGYIIRSGEWHGRERHAKAGNLNNALFQTDGEYILIQDADQIPSPYILDETLGYFRDPAVAFVQTPQWFRNVPEGDPFGSDAPLFYGPIQEGKDGWNAAFFCGSNAVLRREALFQAGMMNYTGDQDLHLRRSLARATVALRAAETRMNRRQERYERQVVQELHRVVLKARENLQRRVPLEAVIDQFNDGVYETVERALPALQEHSRVIAAGNRADFWRDLLEMVEDDQRPRLVAERKTSPLASVAAVQTLMRTMDVRQSHGAMPVMPIATISVTEDMATAMRIHALGWKSVFHPRILATGLAPQDLSAALQQRLRWAQGTIQVMLRENPLLTPGLQPGQRLTYFATMWSYLSGFATVIYLAAPVLYLTLGWTPVDAFSDAFFWRLIPYLLVNQLLFLIVSRGLKTWRGQQYSIALFPVWIQATISAVRSVWFGKDLSFVVTPKTRQNRVSPWLVWPQLVAMFALAVSVVVGLARLAIGMTTDGVPVTVNVLWALYDLAALSVLLDALARRAPSAAIESTETARFTGSYEGYGAGIPGEL